MTKRKTNILFVGLGRVFEHYLYIISKKRIKDLKIWGICDINKKKLNRFSYLNTKKFNSIEQVVKFNEKPDLVIILTPSGMHYRHSKFFLNENFNVLVEKPITLKPKQGEELRILSKRKKLFFSTVFQNRFNKSLKLLKSIINKGKVGKVLGFSVNVLWCRNQKYYNDGWHGKWKYDGGVINQQAIHHLDALNWIVGPVQSVMACTQNSINKLEGEDTINILIKLKNGSTGTFQATTAARPKDIKAVLSVYGSKGFIDIEGQAMNKIGNYYLYKNQKIKKSKFNENIKNGYGLGHIELISKVIKTIKSGKNVPVIPIKEAIFIQNIIHSLYCSARDKKWVKISDKLEFKKLGKGN